MIRYVDKIIVIILTSLLVLSGLAIIAGTAAGTPETTSEDNTTTLQFDNTRGTRANEINHDLELVVDNGGETRPDNKFDQNYYLGDKSRTIRIYLKNLYESDPYDTIRDLYVNISSSDSVFEITDGEGQMENMYFEEVDSWMFVFNIGSVGTLGYGHTITIRAEYVTVNDNYVRSVRSGTMNLNLRIRSGLRSSAGADENYEVQALTESNNQMKLYSGATFQKIQLTAITNIDTITDVEATLSSPPEEIEIEIGTEKAKVDKITSSKSLYWRIDVTEGAEAGIYSTGDIKFKYIRTYGTGDTSDDATVTETLQSNVITFTIDYTPILSPPEDNEFTNTNYNIEQKVDTSQKINVEFKNSGNIGLRNIEVTLDLDNANYMRPLGFYYDEGAWASQSGFGLTQTIEDLPVNDKEQVSFEFFADPSVPPGKYLVPVTYTAYYYDDGSTGQATGFIQTNEFEFYTIEDAVEHSSRGAYIYVSVIDSTIDILAKSTTNLIPGSRNIPITVTIENKESYDFTGVKVYLECGLSTPILKPGDTSGIEDKLGPEEVGTFPASSSTTLTFIADVDPTAVGGLFDVNLYITGFDELKNEYVIDTESVIEKTVQLRVTSISPDFVISKVTTTAIESGKTFTLTINLRNSGGSDASEVYVLFNGSSNLFQPEKGVLGPYPLIKVNAEQALSFSVNAGEVAPGGTYNVQILLNYKDPEGKEVRFNEAPPLEVTLRAAPEEVEEEFSLDFGLAVIFAILILLVAIIVAAIIIRGAIKPKGGAPSPQGPPAPKAGKSKAAPARRAAPAAGPAPAAPPPPPPAQGGQAYPPPPQAGQPPQQEVYY